MKKSVLFLLMLFTFVGVSNVQADDTTDATDTSTDLTSAAGVVPALSTASGTQYAYYLRSVQYSSSFLSLPGNLAATTTTTTDLTKFSIEKSDKGWQLCKLNTDDTRNGVKLHAYGGGAPKVWASSGDASKSYDYKFISVTGDDVSAVTYVLQGTDTNGNALSNKYLYAPNANCTQSSQSVTLWNNSQATYSASNKAFQWQFIPANEAAKKAAALTINVQSGDDAHGNLATFSASYPTTKPSGYTVYTASADDGKLMLNELSGDVIPGGVGVLLKGDVNASLSIQPSLETATATSALTATNDGSYTVPDGTTCYGLGMADGQLAFCAVNANTTFGSNKAYYAPTTTEGAQAITMAFADNEITGIQTINTATKRATIYDLSGRCVAKPAKGGIYISQGKKFIVK